MTLVIVIRTKWLDLLPKLLFTRYIDKAMGKMREGILTEIVS